MVTIMLKTITKATATTIKVTAAATTTTGATILAAKKILQYHTRQRIQYIDNGKQTESASGNPKHYR